MIITGMRDFQSVCLNKLTDWYNKYKLAVEETEQAGADKQK